MNFLFPFLFFSSEGAIKRTVLQGDNTEAEVVLTLNDVLLFATGANVVPPTGFEKEIEIGFFTPKENSTRYPTASTCGLQLQLPRGIVDTDEFVKIMAEGILNAPGFGKV